MADIIDQAQELTETMQAKALEQVRSKIPPFTGYCASCGEPITKGRYCGKECRDDPE